ncbi:MAG: hypothetical protein JJ974_05665 [Phycisphaerales bacterium]|nr:hypothetical protein [Phycisphaerales bacterium]
MIIHLVAPPSTDPTSRARSGRQIPTLLLAKTLATQNDQNARIFTIGDSSSARSAQLLGLHPNAHLTPVLGLPNSLKRILLSRLTSLQSPPTRIVCWSDELIDLATHAATQLEIPAELVSTKPNTITKPPQNIDTIRVVLSEDHDTWTTLRRTCQSDHTLESLITQPPPSPESRAEARAACAIDDDTIVIAATADAPHEVDAREFAFLLGLLSVSGYSTLGLIPSTAANLDQALRHHRGLNSPFRILTTTDPITTNLPLLDAYIHPNDTPSGSSHLLDHLLQSASIPILNLRHSGKAGFSRAQGTAGQLLDEMDQIVHSMQSRLSPTPA